MPTHGRQPLRNKRRSEPCAVAGCQGVARWLPRSPYCLKHRQRQYRVGHPTMYVPTVTDLKKYRAPVQRALSRHFDSPTMRWALRALERDLLNYRATNGYGYEVWTEARMQALKASEVKPLVLLQRLCECYALYREEGHRLFPTPKTWFAWLARRILTTPRRCIVPTTSGATQLKACGQVIEDVLGRFARATLMRMDKDEAERLEFRKSCEALASTR